MTSFKDIYLPDEVPGYPCISIPMTNTTITVTAGGKENRNQNWDHPRHKFILPDAEGREWATVEALRKRWYVLKGPFHSFPWRDPLDFASVDLLEPNEDVDVVEDRIARTDQTLGTGDGATRAFQIIKTYTVSGHTYARDIHLPVTASLLVEINGKAYNDPTHSGGAYSYTVTRPGGVITFDRAIPSGHVVKAGYRFDVEVRFEGDDVLEALVRTVTVGGFSDITLIEVRPC